MLLIRPDATADELLYAALVHALSISVVAAAAAIATPGGWNPVDVAFCAFAIDVALLATAAATLWLTNLVRGGTR